MRWGRGIGGAWGVLAVAAVACADDPVRPTGEAAFEVVVSGETFVVEVVGEENVAALEARLASGVEGVLMGPLVAGDGGFNAPWSWHLDAEGVHAADVSIELCDGRPSMVEADLPYWLGAVGAFCPWGARVVKRLR